MSLIDNRDQTLQQALKNALSTAEKIDISVGYFYFSGFKALANEIKDKKVRILVGMEVDPNKIARITQYAREGEVDLSRYQPERQTTSKLELKHNYQESFVSFVNDSDIFDDPATAEIFEMYVKKIQDGSLEIRKTLQSEHGKMYLIYNKPEHNQNSDFPGTVFMGSGNLTYSGLTGQGELNDSFREKVKFNEYKDKFEELWSDSQSIAIADKDSGDEFIQAVKPRIWQYSLPKPYYIYVRVLYELFFQEKLESLLTPNKITHGIYSDLEYQIDAIRIAIDKLNKYDGIILADVVGLGKSVIASAIARNLDIKTVIIAPPHLKPQWEDYKEEFGVRGSRVFSSGGIEEVYERYKDSQEPMLIILDEAHRYRNEDTNDYKLLHQVCRSHPENKILLLTATPFNNDPKDVFALIKLFQTPGQTTIRSVDNLSLRYRELIQRYKRLRHDMTKNVEQEKVDKEANEIAAEQRRLIEQIIIRRSRLDLEKITRYREDLQKQNIAFAEVRSPELLEYKLGDLFDLYAETLEQITEDGGGFIGARYKPTTYLNEENRKKFIEKFKDELEDETDLRTAQTNLAKFMRRLLVMRFESSKEAFRLTLNKMIESNERIEEYWDKLGVVPIMKKGGLPDPQDYDLDDGEESDALNQELEFLRNKKGFLEVPKEMLEDSNFIEQVRHDTVLLKGIRDKWFDNSKIADSDPKLDEISKRIDGFLKADPEKKIVIFSSYKDTVDYLGASLKKRDYDRILNYTAADSQTLRQVIRENFDASLPENKQKNDFDVLIATDALSEGFNLHRAGIVINYDIPYNPTRVIQRVGRINRINKKVFDYLEVYNCFPTSIGESETRVKAISTLKMKLINAVVGSDTRTLTKDEELVSFFKDEFKNLEKANEELSWDTVHREAFDEASKDADMMKTVEKLPRRSRVKRVDSPTKGVVVFGKKGQHSIFTCGDSPDEAHVVSAESALGYFVAKKEEEGQEVDEGFASVFNTAKEKLFAKHELPKIQGRRASAINVLKVLGDNLPNAKDYCDDISSIIKNLDDISDGTLKDIAQLDTRDLEGSYARLKEIIPANFIRNILNRVNRNENEEELLLFAEQLK